MKICIVSDSHDRADALASAVRESASHGAEAVIHCGDVIGTQTLRAALGVGLPMHVIHGNNLGDPVSLARDAALLAASGLAHRSSVVVDPFPHTPHIEVITRFERRGAGS